MEKILISAVRAKIQRCGDQWVCTEDRMHEAIIAAIESDAQYAELTDEDILTAYRDSGHVGLAHIANWAMSAKVGYFVELATKFEKR